MTDESGLSSQFRWYLLAGVLVAVPAFAQDKPIAVEEAPYADTAESPKGLWQGARQ
jgi:hypothetical protein